MKNKKRATILILVLCVVCLAAAFVFLYINNRGVQDEKLKVTVLKVGKADAIVLQSGGRTMMIDTGEVDDAEKVVQFLKSEGVTEIDAVVITHFDKDHVGAAGLVVEEFNVDRVLIPDYEGTRSEYFDFMNAMKAALIEPVRVSETSEFSFGESSVLIEPPVNYDVDVISDAVDDYDNTLSLITTVKCGEKTFLFMADADRRRIMEWLGSGSVSDVDFLKVPHHGLFSAAMEPLLKATTPEYAAITCSKKNPADDSTLELLGRYGVNVFQTRDGRITAVTDGSKLDVRLN